jgi:hypothetical protein
MPFPKLPASAHREAFEEDTLLAPPGEKMARGRISYDPETGIELTAIEADWFPNVGKRAGGFWSALHGETFLGAKFTLFDCGIRNLQKAGSRARADMRAGTLVLGAQVSSPEEIVFKRMSLSLRGLREWLTGGYCQIEPTLKEGKEDSSVRFLSVDIGDAYLEFLVEPRESGGRYRWVEETRAGLSVTVPEPIPLLQWQTEWIDPLRHLMLFANREQSLVESLSGLQDPAEASSTIRIFERHETSIGQTTVRSFYQRDLLPAGIIGDTAELTRLWFAFHAKLGPAAGFLFGTLNSAGMTIENKFLNLMAFAEAYHRTLHDEKPLSKSRHASYRAAMLGVLPDDPFIRGIYDRDLALSNRQSQRERMTWLVGRAALEDWSSDFEGHLVAAAIDTRNWLTHWGKESAHVVGGAELALLNPRLLWVIESNMLEDIGLGIGDVEKCQPLAMSGTFHSKARHPIPHRPTFDESV